jgi:hypothetical protein
MLIKHRRKWRKQRAERRLSLPVNPDQKPIVNKQGEIFVDNRSGKRTIGIQRRISVNKQFFTEISEISRGCKR